jgi:hypothetical protein
MSTILLSFYCCRYGVLKKANYFPIIIYIVFGSGLIQKLLYYVTWYIIITLKLDRENYAGRGVEY